MDGGGAISGEDDGKYFYVSAGIALPSAGSRSATDETENGTYDPSDDTADSNDRTNSDGSKDNDGNVNPDYEYGYDYENDVRSMILVIADTDDKYITHTVVKGISQVPAGTTNFDFVANGEIKHSDLEAAYGTGGLLSGTGKKKVNIYVFCNYTARLLELFENGNGTDKYNEWYNWAGKVEEDGSPAGSTPSIDNTIWAKRSFLMTNARVFTTEFPAEIGDWSDYADKNHPFQLVENAVDNNQNNYDEEALKPIQVERVAARIDFRDGSPTTTDPNTYKLAVALDDDGEKGELNLFSVELTRMSLVNMSKSFYYLRRVSNDGYANKIDPSNNKTSLNGWKLAGAEKPTNNVVDTDAEVKSKVLETSGGMTVNGSIKASEFFNFPLYKATTENTYGYDYNKASWYTDNISTVLGKDKDTWEGKPNGGDYHIWRYVTENTIPERLKGDNDVEYDEDNEHRFDYQTHIQSVGVVFKGSIIAGDDINEFYYDYTDTGSAATQGAGTGTGTGTGDGTPERPYVSMKTRVALAAAAKKTLPHSDGATPIEVDKSASSKEKAEEIVNDALEGLTEYNYPVLYSYQNMLYAGIDGVAEGAVRRGKNSPLYFAVENVLANWYRDENGTEYKYAADKSKVAANSVALDLETYYAILTDEDCKYTFDIKESINAKTDANFMLHAPENGITVYQISNENDGENWGYYCYYFYWNRHNDNLKSGRMGRMEFATVRNNVYKLAVTAIGQLGHPRTPGDDPEPVDPNDPDEDPTDYLQVKVEVLPWVVRVNDITF